MFKVTSCCWLLFDSYVMLSYILALGNIFRHYGINLHCYADDTHLCVNEVHFSNSTAVKLNYSSLALKPHSQNLICSIAIANATIPVSTQVKSLGVILDSDLSLSSHINNVSWIAFFHLRNISRLCPALTQHSTEVLVNTLVTSRIDYYNAILAGIPNKIINRLQLVQNTAARIISRCNSTEHVTTLMI